MSFSGWLNDTLTGNPPGTADAQSAAIAQGQTKILTNYQSQLAQGLITPNQYAQITGDYSTQAPPSNSIQATAQIVGAGTAGLISAAGNPGQVLNTGLSAIGTAVGGATGNVAQGVGAGITNGLWNFVKQIPWWVWIIVAAVAIHKTVGFGFITRHAKAHMPTR